MLTNRHPLNEAQLILVINKERILKSLCNPHQESDAQKIIRSDHTNKKTVLLIAGRQLNSEIVESKCD